MQIIQINKAGLMTRLSIIAAQKCQLRKLISPGNSSGILSGVIMNVRLQMLLLRSLNCLQP